MSDPSIKLSSRGAFSYQWNKCIDNNDFCLIRFVKSVVVFFQGLFGGYTVSVAEIDSFLKNDNYCDSICAKERGLKKHKVVAVTNAASGEKSINEEATKEVIVKKTMLNELEKIMSNKNFSSSDERFSEASLKLLGEDDTLQLFNSAIIQGGYDRKSIAFRLMHAVNLSNLSGRERVNAMSFFVSNNLTVLLKKLLSHGNAGINDLGSDGHTPLMNASQSSYENCVKLLLEHGAKTDQSDDHGFMPIHYATRSRKKKCLILLLDAGANVNSIDDEKATALYYATVNNDIECVNVLLGREETDVNNLGNNYGETPLECACRLGGSECVSALLKKPNLKLDRVGKDGNTHLSGVLINGHYTCLSLLMHDDRIDLNKENADGITPLLRAISSGSISIVCLKVFLCTTKRLKLDAKDPDGNTLLHYAATMDNVEYLNVLLEKKDISSQINDTNNEGSTALHLAVSAGNIGNIKRLLAVPDINVSAKDKSSDTPFDCLDPSSYCYEECKLALEEAEVAQNDHQEKGQKE